MELTGPVVLFFVPKVVALTFAEKLQDAFDASDAPDKVTLLIRRSP
jgi:hypothetical protein